MSADHDELFQLMLGRTTTKAVERILAAGYRKPRTIEHCYDDNGPSELLPLAVILSGGKPAIKQYDQTWMDWDGSSWDDWELEYPLTVLHEPETK